MSDRFKDIFEAVRQPVEPDSVEPETEQKTTPKKAIAWDELIEEKPETKRLNLDISADTDQKLAARAKRLKITKAALVRRLIEAYLENVE